jgi:AcrR family transcriptional regulator
MNRRTLLLDKAEELFSEHGYEGTSIRLLAREAGMNVAMISYYFGSKEKLFEALVEERTSSIRDRLKQMTDDSSSPMLRLEEIIRLYVDRILHHKRFHRLLLHELSINCRPDLQERLAEVLIRNMDELRRVIRDGIEQGCFRTVDVDLTIMTLIGTVNQLIVASEVMRDKIMNNESESSDHLPIPLKDRLYRHLYDLMTTHLLINNPN